MLRQRRWTVLAVVAALVLGTVVGGPHLWAWYHWRAALADLERYHSADAWAHLKKCLSIWPSSAPAHFLAARAARRCNDYKEAERYLRRSESLDPGLAEETALEWTLLRAAGGDLTPTVEDTLLGRLEREPGRAALVFEALVQGYSRTYRVPEALACVDRWLKLQPDNVQALFMRGAVWNKAQRLQNGLPDFRRVLELDDERDDARWFVAAGLLDAGRYEEAEAQLKQLQRKDPANPAVRVRLAQCQKGLGYLDKARRLLREVLDEDPANAAALCAEGDVELAAGHPDKAAAAFRQAATATPNDYRSQWGLYQALRQQGKDAEADRQKAHVEQLKDRLERLGDIMTNKMSKSPYDPGLYCEVGTILIGLGQGKAGAGWLESALRKDANYRPAHVALAAYYREEGDAQKAAFHRQQADALPQKAQAATTPPRSP
jgi:tetratricopeptide (TPR) repeat protein